jgi:ethanolamine permease
MDQLKKSLSPLLLWGIGVGNVISGMYFGWNLGLEKGGTLGMGLATLVIILMYICFSYSYAELACAIPKAGGGFDFTIRAFGKNLGFAAGISQVILYLFGPPAIALGVATNLHLAFSQFPVIHSAVVIYIVFTIINIIGVKTAASFEIVVTIIAVIGLLVFACVAMHFFKLENLSIKQSINGASGVVGAIPFAIWFFLGIEGLANVAEESANPAKDLSRGFSYSIITLIILCIITFVFSIGVGGWEKIVFNGKNEISDSPLPLALQLIYGNTHWLYYFILYVSILGLVASFHGGLLAGGRATFELSRIGFAPKWLSQINHQFKTPANALIINSLIGIIIILSGKTGQIITLAVFGLLTLYILSMASLLQLRKTEPNLARPFKVQIYPLMPVFALIICIFCLFAMVVSNVWLAVIFMVILAISYILFRFFYTFP